MNKKILMFVMLMHSPAFADAHNSAKTAEAKKEPKICFVNTPSISATGKIGFEMAGISNDKKLEEDIHTVRMGLSTMFLNLKAEGEASNGLIYSLNARVLTDANSKKVYGLSDSDKKAFKKIAEATGDQTNNEDLKKTSMTGNKIREAITIFDRVWLELKGAGFGTVHIGNYLGAHDLMAQDASSIMGGNGGMIMGNWMAYYNLPFGVHKNFRQTGDTRAATKLTYYTPRLEGFQLGVSYTPRSDAFGAYSDYTQVPASLDKITQNSISGGVNYHKDFSGVNLNLGFTGSSGKAIDADGKMNTLEDVLSWEIATRITTGPFDIAAGYLDNGKSWLKKGGKDDFKDSGAIYDIGASYTIGAAKIALGAFYTTHTLQNDKKATLNAYSLTADYKIQEGLVAYIDVTKIDGSTDDEGNKKWNDENKDKDPRASSNKGYVGFIGMNISF